MLKRKELYLWCISSFLLAISITDLFRSPFVLLLMGSIFLGALFKYFKITHLLYMSMFFLLGVGRVFIALPSFSENHIINLSENDIEVTGTVDSFPQYRETKTQFVLDNLRYKEKILEGKILIDIDPLKQIHFGDTITIQGTLKKPENINGFAYDRFLEKDGIYVYISKGTIIERTEGEKGNSLENILFDIRYWFEAEIKRKLPEPESSYALGILLGNEHGLGEEIINQFNTTGLRHLLALSGFNITILIIVIFWAFQIFPKKISLIMTILCITCFVIMTGSSSSVVRAAIMGSLGVIFLHSGNRSSPFLLLGWSLFGMVLWNPFILLSDISLQFSILAVLGLLWISPFLEKNISENIIPSFFGMREALFATVGAQITTTPLTLFAFEQFSIIAPLANMIVAPLTSIAMFLSFFTLIPFLGWIFVPFAWAILKFSLVMTHLMSMIPFAQIQI